MDQEKCCGTCKWHVRYAAREFVCDNYDSEYFAELTEYSDCCEEWEER